MMVNRRHLEETFSSGLLEISDLNDNGKNLDEVNQTHHQNDPGHTEHIGRTCHETAQCQRTGVTHKYLGRMHIKEQEAQKCACHSCGHRLDAAAQRQGRDREENSYHSCHAGSQAVQTVGQVDSVDKGANVKRIL